MQQMQEPEGRAYNEGYQADPVYPIHESEPPRYRGQEGEQQKLQPISSTDRMQRAMAIMFMIVTSMMLGISIAAFVFATISLSNLTDIFNTVDDFARIVASFVLSLLMLLLVITAFVSSIVQLSLIEKKFRKSGNRREI